MVQNQDVTLSVSFLFSTVISKTIKMKKATSLIFSFILTIKIFSLHAQDVGTNNSNYWYYYDVYSENEQNVLNKKNAVKQKTVISKSGHNTTKTIVVYDTSGRVRSYKDKNREVRITYFKENLKQGTSIFKKGNLVTRDSLVWDNKKLKSIFHYNKHNIMNWKQTYKYDSTFVVESGFEKLKKRKFVEENKTVYEYYPDYSYKKITYYRKGKPSYYSVFDCNPIGENHKIKKDSTYNCVKYDLDSLGNKIKVSIVNEKNNSEKIIEYFNNKDQRIAQKIYDLTKNQILQYISYKPGANWAFYTKYITYKNGKENYRSESIYNENDLCVGWAYYRKGKSKSRTSNLYSSKGLIEKTEQFNRHNKKKTETSYLYEFYSN
jgi:hypothetical protein